MLGRMSGESCVKITLNSKKITLIFLIIIFALGIFLRADLFFFNRSFWFDEAALAINVLKLPYLGLFGELSFWQSAPPMFLVETKFLVSLFSDSEFVFRLLPFLMSFFTFFLFYYYVKYYLKSSSARLLALFLFAINTNLIFYSTEFKPYIIDVFAVISMPFLIYKLKLKSPLLLGLFFALMPYYSYASGIVALALTFVLFIFSLKNKKYLKNFFIFFLIQFFNLFLFALHLGAVEKTRAFMQNLWSASYIENNFSNLFPLILDNIYYIFHPYKFILSVFPYFLPLLFLLICAFGAFLIFKKDKFKFSILLSPYFALLILAYIKAYPYYDRLSLFLTPIFIILFSKFLDILNYKKINFAIFSLFIIFSLLPVINSQNVMKNLPSQDLWAYKKLCENYKKNEIIVVDYSFTPQFIYYTKRLSMLDFEDKNVVFKKLYYNNYEYLNSFSALSDADFWVISGAIKFPDAILTKPVIEFIGQGAKEFLHYNKGKTDIYYVAK